MCAGVYQLSYDAATGTYTAVNQARAACYSYLAAYPCGFTGAANAAAVTSYNQVRLHQHTYVPFVAHVACDPNLQLISETSLHDHHMQDGVLSVKICEPASQR